MISRERREKGVTDRERGEETREGVTERERKMRLQRGALAQRFDSESSVSKEEDGTEVSDFSTRP